MTVRTFIVRSLRFHWRSHLGVLLGAMLSTAILMGALQFALAADCDGVAPRRTGFSEFNSVYRL